MLQEMIDAVIRHALTGAGAVMVAHGIGNSDQIQAVVGGVMAAISIYMSYRNKQAMLAKQGG
jgi:hypothetical protein